MKNKSIYKQIAGKNKIYKKELVIKEDVLHYQCISWFYNQYGDFRYNIKAPMLCHIANETPKSKNRIQMIAYANKMKKLGKIKGIQDLMLRRQDGFCIFIELKAIDNDIKDEQRYIYDYMNQNIQSAFVVKRLEEFMQVVNDFLK